LSLTKKCKELTSRATLTSANVAVHGEGLLQC